MALLSPLTSTLRLLGTSLVLASLCACGDAPAQDHGRDAAVGGADGTQAQATTTNWVKPSRQFRFSYEARIPPAPAGTKVLRVWTPLPRDEEGVQQVRNLNLEAPQGARITTSKDFGNRYVYVELLAPGERTPEGLVVRWSATVLRATDNGQGKGAMTERYLAPDRLVPLGDEAREVVTRLDLLAPHLGNPARARLIFDDVLDAMAYDKTEPGWGDGDFLRSLTVCKGNCTDFHSRFIGVGRAAGLAIRFTMGIPIDPSKTSYNSYHCWAHWLDDATQTWQPVDISEADKIAERDPEGAARLFGSLDPNRITLTYGRDLILEPPQAGPALNYLVFPYVEADGVQVPMDKSMWTFSWVDL